MSAQEPNEVAAFAEEEVEVVLGNEDPLLCSQENLGLDDARFYREESGGSVAGVFKDFSCFQR